MERDPNETSAHESAEAEGIPDIGRPHPLKRDTGDPQEGLMVPPRDEARAAEDHGVTAEEQREGLPLDDRLAEEVPDTEPGARETPGRLREEGFGFVDDEKDLVGEAAEDEVEDLTAEEAAVRVEETPGGLVGGPDSYLEDDPPAS